MTAELPAMLNEVSVGRDGAPNLGSAVPMATEVFFAVGGDRQFAFHPIISKYVVAQR